MSSPDTMPALTTPAAHEYAYSSLFRRYVEFYDFETATLDVEKATPVIEREVKKLMSVGMPLSHVAREAWYCERDLRGISTDLKVMMPEDFNV